MSYRLTRLITLRVGISSFRALHRKVVDKKNLPICLRIQCYACLSLKALWYRETCSVLETLLRPSLRLTALAKEGDVP